MEWLYHHMFLLFSYSTPQTFASSAGSQLALGIGTRDISAAEQGIEDYLKKRGYNEIPGIEKSVDLEGYTIPFVYTQISISPRRHPFLFHDHSLFYFQTEFMSSSFFGEEKDGYKIPLDYEGVDLGDADVDWEYSVPLYTSFALGTQYAPFALSWKDFVLEPGVSFHGGFSSLIARVDLGVDLRNTLLEDLDEDILAENYRVSLQNTIHSDIHGWGMFVEPKVVVPFFYRRFFLQGGFGYRFERIHISVKEKQDFGIEQVETYKGNATFSGNGIVFQGSFGYRF